MMNGVYRVLAITVLIVHMTFSTVHSQAPVAQSEIRFYSNRCEKLYTDLQSAFRLTRPQMVLVAKEEKQTVDCCANLASVPDALMRQAFDQSDTRGHLIKTHYQECFELAVLRRSEKPHTSHFNHQRIGQEIYEKFDLRGLPILPSTSKIRDKVTGALFFRNCIPFDSVVLKPTQIELVLEETEQQFNVRGFPRDRWETTITVLAAADFDEDKIEDLLVSIQEVAGAGSYRGHMTLVLSRIEKNGLIQAKSNEFLVKRLREWQQSTKPLGGAKPISK